jgi:hypothetical protein
MIKVTSEEQLLNPEVRLALIKGFNGQANGRRKDNAFKAYECLKDKNSNYVMAMLLKQFETKTVVEMQYAISNISILRKVIDKLAKVYSGGVKRTGATDTDTKAVEAAAKYLKLNTAMKKANKYFRTFKNTLIYVRPMKNGDKHDVKVEVLPPFKYDAVEHPDNPEMPLAIVLSDYSPSRPALYALGDAAFAGRQQVRVVGENGERLVQEYSPPSTNIGGAGKGGDDNDKREYIWWTENYHFTTNSKGAIIADTLEDAGFSNPISKLPFVNLCGEQDGCFWADGGEDLVDTGISVNVDITNVKHIGNQQGYGQMYMTGKDLPKSVKAGPTSCIQLEQKDKDEPAPTIGFLTSNPPLADLKSLIEMQVALMLTTNNLSTSGFKMSLQGGSDFASGIAMMIDKSESIEDIDDQAQIFIEKEPVVWSLFYDWLAAYKASGSLTDEARLLKPIKKPLEIVLAFPSPKPVTSEKEELEVIKQRKELGLNTEVELLMRDDPSLTEESAKLKLAKIKEEKVANAAAMGLPANGASGGGKDPETGAPVSPDAMIDKSKSQQWHKVPGPAPTPTE